MPKLMVTQREVETRIKCESPFVLTTGNMRGNIAFDDTGWTYYVTSYGVDIARVRYEQVMGPDGEWERESNGKIKLEVTHWITPVRYSVTTSRHTNYARRAWNIPRTK
jgi:hypothetical protein